MFPSPVHRRRGILITCLSAFLFACLSFSLWAGVDRGSGSLEPAGTCARPPFPTNKKERYVITKSGNWKPGETIRVYFLNGTREERGGVEHYAREWERFGHFKFDFRRERKTRKEKSILIRFHRQRPGVAGWSTVGYGTTSTTSPNMGYHRGRQHATTVLHEFGHMLGFFHEQNNPAIRRALKRDEAIRHFMKMYNTSYNKAYKMIYDTRWDKNRISGRLDPVSVMGYYFPGKLFHDGKSFGTASNLSRGDIAGIMRKYPGRTAPRDIAPTYLYYLRGKKRIYLETRGSTLQLFVNRKLVATLENRDNGRAKGKYVDLSPHMTGKRTRIGLKAHAHSPRNFMFSAAVFGKRPDGKRAYVTSYFCQNDRHCVSGGRPKPFAYYLAHFDNRNRGQANYYDDPKSGPTTDPVVDPVVDPVKKKYDESLNRPLLIAAYEGRAERVTTLLRRRADPNAKYQGWTPLLYAAYFGHMAVIRALLNGGADANVKVRGWRAIDFARSKGRKDIVRLLTPKTNRAWLRKRGRAPRP